MNMWYPYKNKREYVRAMERQRKKVEKMTALEMLLEIASYKKEYCER